MKVYRFGKEKTVCHNIVIVEDNGEVRIAMVGVRKVREYIGRIVNTLCGVERLRFGAGSSIPFKDKNGKMNEKYVLIYEDNK